MLGENYKKLGFGLMRLPKLPDSEQIDVEQVKCMVDKFIAAGFTYFDTAWAYEGSEVAIRKALVERYPRDKFQLATKNAAWINCQTRDDAIAQFETSLAQTGAGYFDFYLLHNLGETRTEFFEKFDLWSFVQEQKAAGKIKHIGFSFHDTPESLEKILQAHPEAEFVQLQINYADWENPAIQSRGVYEVARKYGKPVIVMEPVKGGMLATPPETVKAVFDKTGSSRSLANWAIGFAADLPGVMMVLSGMSNVSQMDNNLQFMQGFNGYSEAERQVLAEAQTELAKVPLIPCTTCNYCAKVCPMNIGISGSFTSRNYLTLYGDMAAAKHQEWWLVDAHGKQRAANCIRCGACESACPQHIEIRKHLEEIAETMA